MTFLKEVFYKYIGEYNIDLCVGAIPFSFHFRVTSSKLEMYVMLASNLIIHVELYLPKYDMVTHVLYFLLCVSDFNKVNFEDV